MQSKKQLFTIFIIIFIDMLGFGLIIPIVPFYLEDFFSDPGRYLLEVQGFLGLPRIPLPSYEQFNAGTDNSLSSEIRSHLIEYFRPYNKQLYDYLGTDFGWDS